MWGRKHEAFGLTYRGTNKRAQRLTGSPGIDSLDSGGKAILTIEGGRNSIADSSFCERVLRSRLAIRKRFCFFFAPRIGWDLMLVHRNGQHWLVHAPAKLNLYLEIIGRREDGFHDLESCFVSVSLYDTLRFRPSSAGLSLDVYDFNAARSEDVPADNSNLVLKAANALRECTGCTQGADIQLTKRIPSQAGMGGGSSDAAATLVTLNRMWGLGLAKQELHEIAATLGSDVNFFVEQTRAAMCRGRGEIVEPILLRFARPLYFVIAKPDVGLSTADVFRACQLSEQPGSSSEFLSDLRHGLPALHNRLGVAAASLCPELQSLAERFEVLLPGRNQMTGSGSAWFGIANSQRHAIRIAKQLRNTGISKTYTAAISL